MQQAIASAGYAIDLEGLRSGSAGLHGLDTVEGWPLGRRAVSLTPQFGPRYVVEPARLSARSFRKFRLMSRSAIGQVATGLLNFRCE